ncbi:MAG TPA: NAD(P)/FAD-dependent oxidoreductase [Chloroflexia bacterium]|nr:NAD(P)/FAD-dependent oxidoreductase [Chloroflexia bacterium]
MPEYDVIIVGGSFAGLAVARQLRGYRVLIVDQRPIGAHQTSACGAPLPAIQALGAEAAALDAQDTLVLHTGGRTFHYPLRHPFVTLDYAAYCQAVLAQTEAEVWLARATGVADGVVETTRGPVAGRFIVDASGWQSLRRAAATPARAQAGTGYGIEAEVPGACAAPGLHFYFEKALVRHGYAWAFPCGPSTRFGICTFDKGVRLGPPLAALLARFGQQPGRTHGGVLAVDWRPPLAGAVFVVGDAAGQCLPLTAEGIRPAVSNGSYCGRCIAAALAGAITPAAARARYQAHVQTQAYYHTWLLWMQRGVAATPEPLIALAGWIGSRPAAARVALDNYFARSGGLSGLLPATPAAGAEVTRSLPRESPAP